jgi:hypothetical protein
MPLLSRLAASSAKGFGMYGLVVPYTTDYLVVAGGGGGGGWTDSVGGGGGGGAGGLLTGTTTLIKGQVYTATVGNGGAGNSGAGNGVQGSNSSLTGSGISIPTAIGGGYGGGTSTNGGSGGSGGGGAGYRYSNTSGGTGTAGQGFNGGNGIASSTGGAGGGAGGAASNGTPGIGVYSSITGSSVYYGIGGYYFATSKAMPANSGYGGDGWVGPFGPTAQNGASGVVIISVPTRYYTGTTTGSPTVTTSGLNTVIKFTSSGTYTA